MGIFSTVKNFIKTEVLGVTDDTQVKPAQKSTKSAKPNAVVECKNVGKNEDTVVINNKQSRISILVKFIIFYSYVFFTIYIGFYLKYCLNVIAILNIH